MWKIVLKWVGALSICATIVTAAFAIDNRYVKEQDAAQTLVEFRSQVNQQANFNKLEFMDRLIEQYELILLKHPNDTEAKNKLEKLKEKRTEMMTTIAVSMEE